ncbi:hypothetical protein QR680_017353 [Steinernema hermaphroditum]|uniref:Tektin n=1 Tax=Steinernema hermaphroditum TaxID=289476 RepID=A0AA39HE84_9BILA|nr:hypothetical protein QR680_017353 [Steinernema hermaphroditum]
MSPILLASSLLGTHLMCHRVCVLESKAVRKVDSIALLRDVPFPSMVPWFPSRALNHTPDCPSKPFGGSSDFRVDRKRASMPPTIAFPATPVTPLLLLLRLVSSFAMHANPQHDDPSEVLRLARLCVREANQKAARMQNQTTHQLVQRVKDLKYWSQEIERELQELKADNEELQRYYRRLAKCAQTTVAAGECNETCVGAQRKRIHVVESLNSRVDASLEKEKSAIGEAAKQIHDFKAIVERQLEVNTVAKNHLLRDFTLKQEAITVDHKSAAMGVDEKYRLETPEGRHLDVREGVPLQRMSELDEWIENTARNLNATAKARANSRKIVQKVVHSTREVAQMMRTEANTVEAALKDSLKTWQDWRDGLRAKLGAKEKEKKTADTAIGEIQMALRQRREPLEIALKRQSQRGLRPGIELCNDRAQHALQAELVNLKATVVTLEGQLEKARESRRKLEEDRGRLERKMHICEHNFAVDYEVLRRIRATYPQEIQSSGFLVVEKLNPK